jgi:hypothetical protein
MSSEPSLLSEDALFGADLSSESTDSSNRNEGFSQNLPGHGRKSKQRGTTGNVDNCAFLLPAQELQKSLCGKKSSSDIDLLFVVSDW